MILIRDILVLQQLLSQIRQNKKIGFVPTLGALHAGHLSLIHRAKQENDSVVVSIFVNPTQFNDSIDYQHYPRSLDSDKRILEEIGIDYLFAPKEKDMYPDEYDFLIKPNINIASVLEGRARPGHFEGMLTIVMKLLLIIQPFAAYFGEKDYQQLKLIQQLTQSFFLLTTIVSCPTVREKSGLPLSSRNARLTQDERRLMESIYQLLKRDSFSDLNSLLNKIMNRGVRVEYLEAMDNRIFLAMGVGQLRLIDNFLKETGPC